MGEKYEVWFRDLQAIVHGILGNPVFSGGMCHHYDFLVRLLEWT